MNTVGLQIQLQKTNALENLHVDEALVFLRPETLALRAWHNPPAMILGRFQNPDLEINFEAHRSDPLPLVHRFSGGGTVYHDGGVLNITLSIPTRLFEIFMPAPDTMAERMRRISSILAGALPVVGKTADVDEHASVFIDGRKVLGCAAYLQPGRLLYHASILVNADLERLKRLTRWDEVSDGEAAVASRRKPVVNLAEYWQGSANDLTVRLESSVYRAFGIDTVEPVTDEAGLGRWMHRELNNLQYHSRGVNHV